MTDILPVIQQNIQNKILEIRGQRVMLDRDLALMYGVETRTLNQAVKRNRSRFPEDFMFQLNSKEYEKWKSQFVISKSEKMGLRCLTRGYNKEEMKKEVGFKIKN